MSRLPAGTESGWPGVTGKPGANLRRNPAEAVNAIIVFHVKQCARPRHRVPTTQNQVRPTLTGWRGYPSRGSRQDHGTIPCTCQTRRSDSLRMRSTRRPIARIHTAGGVYGHLPPRRRQEPRPQRRTGLAYLLVSARPAAGTCTWTVTRSAAAARLSEHVDSTCRLIDGLCGWIGRAQAEVGLPPDGAPLDRRGVSGPLRTALRSRCRSIRPRATAGCRPPMPCRQGSDAAYNCGRVHRT
jgi:hypothetical protein